MRINKTVDEFDIEPYLTREDWETIHLMDGTVYEKVYSKNPALPEEEQETVVTILTSYDNDYDQTLDNLLFGVRNPNTEDRAKSRKNKKYFLPKKLRKLKVRPLSFWVEGESNLTEILSVYSQVSAKYNIGKASASKLFSFLVYLNTEKEKSILDLPLGMELYESFRRRAKAHAYEGYWGKLNKLLQMQTNPLAFRFFIRTEFSTRELKGNFLPVGKKFYEDLTIGLTAYPVNTPQRQRGYNDKGSRKDPSKTKEVEDNHSHSDYSREDSFLNSKEALLHFLYGVTNPVKKETKAKLVIEYQRRQQAAKRKQQREELKRIRSLTGECKVYVDEAILARNRENNKK